MCTKTWQRSYMWIVDRFVTFFILVEREKDCLVVCGGLFVCELCDEEV